MPRADDEEFSSPIDPSNTELASRFKLSVDFCESLFAVLLTMILPVSVWDFALSVAVLALPLQPSFVTEMSTLSESVLFMVTPVRFISALVFVTWNTCPDFELSVPPVMVNDEFVPDKTLKAKYKEITTNSKLIEAVELLKDNAGAFSYRSIHGNNKTCSPIKINFVSMEGEHKDTDAYGEFKKNKYEIYINAKYERSPAGAIAPLLAREGLVSKEKTEEDKETAKQLQIAVWTQLCEKISGLESKNDPLIRTQNMLKSGASLDDYSVFLKNGVHLEFPQQKSSNNGSHFKQ